MPAVVTRARLAAALLAGTLVTCALASCGTGSSSQTLPGGQASRGRGLIEYYGCGSCHVIGGIDNAQGQVGPSLKSYSSLRYIAGHLPNTPENTARWIQSPQQYQPGTVMPDLGVTPSRAADIATYLEGQ